ncbi:hypothetical protein [Eubacterium limosum]|uniref:Uncharacterized protein n=1 Tax=Eubacterium limosum TaxID=1736 RepID=A0ABT5UUZ4_EUBLI|nr:hypothetical protein [Eubacterium limosum]MDE1472788.1 hypothetical protein [Eubacterium limosum]
MSESNEIKKSIDDLKRKFSKKNIDLFDMIGSFGILIYTKKIFKSNKELSESLNLIFNIHLPEYIVKSRPLTLARISKIIFELNEDGTDFSNILNKTILIIKEKEKVLEEEKKEKNTPEAKKGKKNENEKLESWLKGL